MTNEELKKKIWSNSISNYLRLGLRLVLGVFLFRMIFSGLPREESGFYWLLWSFCGYGILMDLGFGLAAQKLVAEFSVKQEWDRLSRVLSTIFYFYMIGAMIVVVLAIFGGDWLMGFIHLENEENRAAFTFILKIFLCFIALSLPFGLFNEILYGQQRIALANNLASAGTLVNFVLIFIALQQGWGLKAILLISITCSLVPTIAGGWLALRSLPGVKLSPRLCSRELARNTMKFSLFAYIGNCTNVIMGQTDRLVLGVMLSVSAVPIYQVGSKVADLFGQFTGQLPETLSPAAAHLHATDDRAALRQLMTEGARAQVTLATPMYFICAFWMEGFLNVLTKGQEVSGQAYWVGQVLLLWIYTTIITHSVPKKIFMMTGHERRLTVFSSIEAVANLILSVALVMIFKAKEFEYPILGVAFGSLIPSVIIGWTFLWPWASRYAGVSGGRLANHILFRNWAACMPVVMWGTLCHILPQAEFQYSKTNFVIEAGLAGLIAAMGVWYGSLTTADRSKFREQYISLRSKFFKTA